MIKSMEGAVVVAERLVGVDGERLRIHIVATWSIDIGMYLLGSCVVSQSTMCIATEREKREQYTFWVRISSSLRACRLTAVTIC